MDEVLTLGVELDTTAAEASLAALAASAEDLAGTLDAPLSDAEGGLEGVGDAAEGTSGSLRGASGVMRLVSSDAGRLTAGVLALTRGIGGLKLALGPAVVAVGALTLAVRLYQNEQDRAAAAQERMVRTSEALAESSDRLRDAQMRLAVATGEVTEEEDRLNRARISGYLDTSPAIIRAGEDVAAQNEVVAASILKLRSLIEAGVINESFLEGANQELAEARAELDRLIAVRDKFTSDAKKLIKVETELIEKEGEMKAAVTASADARSRAAETSRELAEAERIRLGQLREFAAMQQTVADIEASANQSAESGVDRILRQRDEQLAQLDEIAQTTQDAIATEAARLAVMAEADRELKELRLSSIQEIADKQKAADDAEQMRVEEGRRQRMAAASDLVGAIGGISDAMFESARKQAETDEKAAQAMLENAKKLAIAETLIQGALGIATATAAYIANPLALAAAVSAVGITTGLQLAAIEGQTLHTGGFRQGAPDEVVGRDGVTRLEGERTISPEGSRQEEQIRQMERGGAGAGVVMVPVYKHFGRFSRDELRRQGPLGNAVRSAGPRVGPGRY